MDEEETRNCPNCKREIPAVNFTIHTVHCARNIRMCPVCKEPVPSADLDDHHKKFHKLLPCKQCGDSVCGTDLEDHIRDSCANTIKTCRFCELELPRRELPAHEGYCGVRTEQCPACGEWVMIKYRQLHLDSNHGFLRLDDDPAPVKKEPLRQQKPAGEPRAPLGLSGSARPHSVANATLGSRPNSAPSTGGPARPTSIFECAGPSGPRNDQPRPPPRYLASSNSGSSNSSASVSPQEGPSGVARSITNGVRKRTNDQPQINTNTEVANKVDKELAISRGAVKKRPAPAPPRGGGDLPYYSALQRQQAEERERAHQNQYNLAHGLPPVLSPAAKLDRLRNMDALHNREAEPPPRARPPRATRRDLQDLKPMSPEQFMARFNELQLREGGAGGAAAAVGGDRFTEIKTSLRELRRGLNEVTAPYNNNNITANNNNPGGLPPGPAEEVRLPCEFCSLLVPADDLVQHQTGCRPDLAQYWGSEPPPRAPPSPVAPAAAAAPAAAPVIPCEFCTESLPVYLINEHQERCAREVDILSAD